MPRSPAEVYRLKSKPCKTLAGSRQQAALRFYQTTRLYSSLSPQIQLIRDVDACHIAPKENKIKGHSMRSGMRITEGLN
jgi:hypothetical protein